MLSVQGFKSIRWTVWEQWPKQNWKFLHFLKMLLLKKCNFSKKIDFQQTLLSSFETSSYLLSNYFVWMCPTSWLISLILYSCNCSNCKVLCIDVTSLWLHCHSAHVTLNQSNVSRRLENQTFNIVNELVPCFHFVHFDKTKT